MGDAQEIAERAAAAMFADDRNAHAMGMELTAVGPGEATVTMAVVDSMVNGLDVCHGGIIFTVADTAMAFASNSRGGTNLAVTASIDFLAPSRRGETLVAVAKEAHRHGRTGIYNIEVSNADGVVAIGRGSTKRVADEGPGS